MINKLPTFGAASLVALAIVGCGSSPTPDTAANTPTNVVPLGKQTVTFHVQEMGERLELL